MNIPRLIQKKRDNEELSVEEIFGFVKLLVTGQVEHVQLGAFLMALYLNGLSPKESAALTSAMTLSGEILSWPDDWKPILVDKHSTGGVGDKISLVLAPALAACGLKVPMVSGRSLGFTGGTLDKLESIPGFTVALNTEQMKRALEVVGCFIAGQTESLVPADRIMYAARDVTATVDQLELITASIVSKKAAESISALVLDVKVGNAAFMKSKKQAQELARMMVQVATKQGIKTVAVLTRMENPIGKSVGNALEIDEAIQTLKGCGPSDIVELVSVQGSILLQTAGIVSSLEEGELMVKKTLSDKSALAKFQEMLKIQGVDAKIAQELCYGDTWAVLRRAIYVTPLLVRVSGWVAGIDALLLAQISGTLGASRTKASDVITHSAGIRLLVDINQKLETGQIWGEVHHDQPIDAKVIATLCNAITMADKPVPVIDSLVLEIIQYDAEQ